MKILLVKPKYLGDVFLLTPAIRLIKENYAECEIHVLVRPGTQGIIAQNSFISRVIKLERGYHFIRQVRELSHEGYDYVFDLAYGDRSRLLVSLIKSENKVTRSLKLPLPFLWKHAFTHVVDIDYTWLHAVERDYELITGAMPLSGDIPGTWSAMEKTTAFGDDLSFTVVIHPFSRLPEKEWPLERWSELCRWLLTKYTKIIISSGPAQGEVERGRKLQQVDTTRILLTEGRVNFQQLAYVIDQSALYMGVDTAVSHLASCTETPTVVLFGSSALIYWHPWKAEGGVVQAPDLVISSSELKEMLPKISKTQNLEGITVATVQAAVERFERKTVMNTENS